jgi:photosystem II stability/assembly factor-like uncharacterized protein
MRFKSIFFISLWILSQWNLLAQKQKRPTDLFMETSMDWVQTKGPTGSLSDICMDPQNPSILFAIGFNQGIYRTSDGGQNWQLKEIPDLTGGTRIEIDPSNSSVLYCNFNLMSKSVDGGNSWQTISTGLISDRPIGEFRIDPINSNNLYCIGYDSSGPHMFRTKNGGQLWESVTDNLSVPGKSDFQTFGLAGSGKIFLAVNDADLASWHTGKLYYTQNDGQKWDELNFGQWEDRFIISIYVNPADLNEIWVGEGPLYNQAIQQPALYRTIDGGTSWNPAMVQLSNGVFPTGGKKLIKITPNRRIFIGDAQDLLYSDDEGTTFAKVLFDPDISFGDPSKILAHPTNPNILYLGIFYTDDFGKTWALRNKGIVSSTVSLLASDPVDPGVAYATAPSGGGVFRTNDFGENWTRLTGYKPSFGDEINVDALNNNTVWYIGEVPFINKSTDRGNSWTVLNNPELYTSGGSFSFNSIYAMAQPADTDTIVYALNNGYGIFKGTRGSSDVWSWNFLRSSEIDYTYSLAVEPDNPNVIYSGYTRKYFQKKAMIRGSYDGGSNWFTALEIDSAEAVTSVAIDPVNVNTVYAASTGDIGGAIWSSSNKGQTWAKVNDYFNFTTIHSFAVPAGNTGTAYAGVWGGGIFKTTDNGQVWKKLESPETFSAASIVVDPHNNNIVYSADRTKPILYKSTDGGLTWSEFFKLGTDHRRLMSVTIDPANSDIVYVSSMKAGGPGKIGGLFRIENNVVTDINNTLPKVVLTLTVQPANPSVLYAVLHESGVYKSTDGGAHWGDLSGTLSGLPESGFSSLMCDPANANVLYLIGGCDVRFDTFASAGINPDSVNGVYRSQDGGISWENINHSILGSQSGAVKSLTFYQNNSNIIYLGTENGVYYSTNGGQSWQKSTGLPYTTLGGIALSQNYIYAFTNGAGVFIGTINADYSINWNQNQKIISHIYSAQLIINPIDNATIYASGYPGGIFKSSDGGITWHEANFGMVSFPVEDPLRQGYYALAISKSNPEVLYLGLYKKGIYKSVNGSATWMPVNGPGNEMFNKTISNVVVDPGNSQLVYVASEEGVFTTSNGGTTWLEMNQGLGSTDVRTLSLNESGTLYAGTRGYGLYTRVNNIWESLPPVGSWGVIWPIWNDRPLYQYTSQLIHPEDNRRMLLGSFPQGIYKSYDGGKTWRERNINFTVDGVFKLVCHPYDPDLVFSGTYNGINRSTDFGEHWEKWNEGWPPEQWVFSIDFDPDNPAIMYACSKNGENEGTGREGFHGIVMKTTNGGKSWFEIMNGLSRAQEFYNIVVDRFDHQTVYVAHEKGGISRTTDGGNMWTEWKEGLTNTSPGTNKNNVTNVLVLSADNSILYFGTSGSGVFRRMISPILPVNNLSADVYDHRVTLRWHFTDFNSTFSQYKVYRSTNYFSTLSGLSSRATISSPDLTSYTDNNVQLGVAYYYAITTVDNTGYENDHFYVLGPVVDFGIYITNTVLDIARTGMAYSDTLTALGGVKPITWKIVSGALPIGITLKDSTGVISGIPVSEGSSAITVQANDAHQNSISTTKTFTMVVLGITSTEAEKLIIPDKPGLLQSYPNPFNNLTYIWFEIPKTQTVVLSIYNTLGEKVKTLENKLFEAGSYSVAWNGSDEADRKINPGLYICVMKSGNYVIHKKIILMQGK